MTVVLPSAEKSLKTLCNNHTVADRPEDTSELHDGLRVNSGEINEFFSLELAELNLYHII